MDSSANIETYETLDGATISLLGLDAIERDLIHVLLCRARTDPDWNDFDVFWMKAVADLYDERKVNRSEAAKTPVYRIAKDLSARLAFKHGFARPTDYRDQLEDLIRRRYKTRREFCKATGLSEDMLSHALAGRKHIGMAVLCEALNKIGFSLAILPVIAPAEFPRQGRPRHDRPARKTA